MIKLDEINKECKEIEKLSNKKNNSIGLFEDCKLANREKN